MLLDVTTHVPVALVVHDPGSKTPPLHEPVTTAPATGWWFELWTCTAT
jgi:hypothetical protein